MPLFDIFIVELADILMEASFIFFTNGKAIKAFIHVTCMYLYQ